MLSIVAGLLTTDVSVEGALFVSTADVIVVVVGHISVSPSQREEQLDVTSPGLVICEVTEATDADEEEIVDEIVADSCVVDGDADDASPPAWLDGGCALDSAGELIVFCFCTTALLRYNNTGLLEMIEEQRY